MRRPLELRTTLTGFPARQFLDSAPSLSFRGASQFKANALQEFGFKRQDRGMFIKSDLGLFIFFAHKN